MKNEEGLLFVQYSKGGVVCGFVDNGSVSSAAVWP